ncbi:MULTISPECIES: DUF308 domain-containing protein [unclassified Enterococcus]|uniref:HdeD family acid-resistance protein n=1 Tax=unclassified Enterococcus TaxID=2608891 RepID=UPI001557497A|nr:MULTISPECIES: DUF308 domain-containing protein [unclassified Enterococcus]MBS7575923.1 DUF308 domain-containing protein [Enterococcus sp. MMGLQ5-2]MBS7583156.1 DUF308 domain-containing protein [Enterococcus sp. MMGLQ5-1]NPD11016.1 hypothetical protein [Enterococcus sp. MMGLQ5-1]NPD35759.1 hypothetical protein [Enterococcus sp. MMGLQ5-2]
MKKSSILDFILGITFLFLGIFSLNRPAKTLGILVIYFGVLAIVRGFTSIFGLEINNKEKPTGLRIFLGVIDIIIGLALVSNLIRGALFLGILFSIWFMVESIINLFINTRFSNNKGFFKILILIFDLFCFAFSIILLFNPLIAVLTLPILVGFSAISFGIALIFQGIRR